MRMRSQSRSTTWTIERGGELNWWIARGTRAKGYERAEHLDEVLEIVALESIRRGIPRDSIVMVMGDSGEWYATVGELLNDVL